MTLTSVGRPTVLLIATLIGISLVVGGLAGWGASALTSAKTTTAASERLGCVDVSTKSLTLISPGQSCATGLVPVVWQTAAAKNGKTGPTGAKGDAGPAGATGAVGPAGARGDSGAAGGPGPAGATGPAGAAGATGNPGPTGATGATGPTGDTGPTGATGATGLAAWSGVTTWLPTGTYAPGPPASVVTYQGGAYVAVSSSIGQVPSPVSSYWVQIAAPGEIGEIGAPGPQGDIGPQGEAGPQGPAGATGNTGPAGPRGPAGTPGDNTFSQQFGTAPFFGTADGTSSAGCTVGEVLLTAGNVSNGLVANGRLLSISNYQALYVLIGTQYGGNGTTDFALPNLISLAPNGMTYSICAVGVFPSRDD